MQELELRQRALEQQEALTKSAIEDNILQHNKRKQRLADKLPSRTNNDLPDAYVAKFQSTM